MVFLPCRLGIVLIVSNDVWQAMHLVYRALDGHTLPAVLPPPLAKLVIPGATTTIGTPLTLQQSQQSVHWAVSVEEKARADAQFAMIDADKDGLVSGSDCAPVLMATGLAPPTLARLWDLCDIRTNGQLNAEQFALALHLAAQVCAGHELPSVLPRELLPPSFQEHSEQSGNAATGAAAAFDVNIERPSEKIYAEIEEIKKEKAQLERACLQGDSDVKLKQAELQIVTRELDHLVATSRQLELQKGEAQKKLDELNDQVHR